MNCIQYDFKDLSRIHDSEQLFENTSIVFMLKIYEFYDVIKGVTPFNDGQGNVENL